MYNIRKNSIDNLVIASIGSKTNSKLAKTALQVKDEYLNPPDHHYSIIEAWLPEEISLESVEGLFKLFCSIEIDNDDLIKTFKDWINKKPIELYFDRCNWINETFKFTYDVVNDDNEISDTLEVYVFINCKVTDLILLIDYFNKYIDIYKQLDTYISDEDYILPDFIGFLEAQKDFIDTGNIESLKNYFQLLEE